MLIFSNMPLWFLCTYWIKWFMPGPLLEFICQMKCDCLSWSLNWALRMSALWFQSAHDICFHFKHVLLTLHNQVSIQIMLYIKSMIWFSPRECSSPPDTDINLWKCAHFYVMPAKSKFLPPLAISHRCKLNCATQEVVRSCTQTVEARRGKCCCRLLAVQESEHSCPTAHCRG